MTERPDYADPGEERRDPGLTDGEPPFFPEDPAYPAADMDLPQAAVAARGPAEFLPELETESPARFQGKSRPVAWGLGVLALAALAGVGWYFVPPKPSAGPDPVQLQQGLATVKQAVRDLQSQQAQSAADLAATLRDRQKAQDGELAALKHRLTQSQERMEGLLQDYQRLTAQLESLTAWQAETQRRLTETPKTVLATQKPAQPASASMPRRPPPPVPPPPQPPFSVLAVDAWGETPYAAVRMPGRSDIQFVTVGQRLGDWQFLRLDPASRTAEVSAHGVYQTLIARP